MNNTTMRRHDDTMRCGRRKVFALRRVVVSSCRRVALVTLLCMATGCAYRLGTTVPAEVRHVYVPSIVNRSGEPGIDKVATASLHREIQREGSFALAREASATSRLEVTVTELTMEAISFMNADPLTPNEYRLYATASVVFTDRDGAPLYAGEVRGETTLATTQDFVSAKLSQLPAVCD
ncbi:MAG: LPS assembly lipoprotein LptE, partial [Kiritimatiellaeota bacterium]|nr:LPS assembly lipoprotein LptE [Kiritimatiellota bacterium]